MKSVEMVLGKMQSLVLLSVSTLIGLSLADDSGSAPAEGNYKASDYGLNISFNSSVIVVLLGLLSFLLFIGFLLLLLCRRTGSRERTRSFRREGTNNRAPNGRGLDRTVIESFPVFSYDLVKGLKSQAMGSDCAVCLNDFEEEEMVRLLPKCSHAFHPECIDMWLSSHTTCPVCRVNLVPAEDSNPTATAEPQTPTEQIAIVVVNGDNEATNGAPQAGHDDSTGHSLVRVRTELEQGTEWYISTPGGLKPGLRKSFSFAGRHLVQKPSSSNAPPACSKPGGSEGDAGHRSRSERWGSNSLNPASFIRSFSERVTPRPREQRELAQLHH